MSRIYSLLWLRLKYIATNKLVLIQSFLPLVLVLIMKIVFKGNSESKEDMALYLLSLVSGMVYSLSSGSLVATMVGEEKEKNNFRTLMLSGVKAWEYLFSVIFYPVVIALTSFVLLPIILDVTIKHWLVYLLVSALSAATIILLNLFVSLLSKNMTQANIYSMIIMMTSIYLPMVVINKENLKGILDMSFIGANTNFYAHISDFSLTDKSFMALIAWLVLTVLMSIFAYRKNRVLA